MIIHSEFIRLLTKEFLNSSKKNLLFCEGIRDGFYGTLPEISKEYESQCYELPCSENAAMGMVLGAASYGLNPIMCLQRVEFALLALEQLVNNPSKISFLTNNKRSNPALLRLVIGRGWGQGPTHSQNLHSLFGHIPGLKVVSPSTPSDAKGLLVSSLKAKTPVIFFEHRWLHEIKGEVKKGLQSNA